MEPCGSKSVHAGHHYVAADSNGYWCEGVAANLDPVGVMAEHPQPRYGACINGLCNGASWPCLPYRLAEALAASQAKVARARALPSYVDGDRLAWVDAQDLRVALADQPEQAS